MIRAFVANGKIINEFAEVPNSIRINGRLKVGLNKWSDEDLAALGYYKKVFEPIEPTQKHGAPYIQGITVIYQAVDANIDTLKNNAYTAIDNAAGEASAKYITCGVGQELRYMTKQNEVKAYLSEQEPDIDNYPILKAEAKTVGIDYNEYAEYLHSVMELWYSKAAEIESIRVGGKMRVRNSNTNTDVLAIQNEVVGLLLCV